MMSQFLYMGGIGLQELIIIFSIFLIPIALTFTATIMLVKSKVDSTTKVLWLLILVFFPLLGPLLYFAIGRRQNRVA